MRDEGAECTLCAVKYVLPGKSQLSCHIKQLSIMCTKHTILKPLHTELAYPATSQKSPFLNCVLCTVCPYVSTPVCAEILSSIITLSLHFSKHSIMFRHVVQFVCLFGNTMGQESLDLTKL